jgi:hypothetical protein
MRLMKYNSRLTNKTNTIMETLILPSSSSFGGAAAAAPAAGLLAGEVAALSSLPASLQRHLAAIGALERQSVGLGAELKRLEEAYMAKMNARLEAREWDNLEDADALGEIDAMRRRARRVAEEKVASAAALRAEISGHIANVDVQLQLWELEQSGGSEASAAGAAAAAAAEATPSSASAPSVRIGIAADVAVDESEPTYCRCGGPSHGLMLRCDNAACPIGWFHFDCVGLSARPQRGWWCYGCNDGRHVAAAVAAAAAAPVRQV